MHLPLRGLCLCCAVLVASTALWAQNPSARPVIRTDAKHDVSPNLRDIPPVALPSNSQKIEQSEETLEASPGPYRSARDLKASAGAMEDPVLQSSAVTPNNMTLGLTFDGIAGNGWTVADPNVAVGATQVVQFVNDRYAVYSKTTGAKQLGPSGINTLWNGFGGSCQNRNNGDPIVQYDKAAARWVMMQHATPPGGPFYLCVAVSTTSDATGSYNRYAFQVSQWPDYPKLGVWPDAYYVSYDNLLNGGGVTSEACALNRSSMLNGSSATSVCFAVNSKYVHLLPADADGTIAPPSGAPNYFMNLGTNSLNIWQFSVNWSNTSNSTFTGPTNISVASFSKACSGGTCVPQQGTGQQLDSLGDRLMYRLAYRHFNDGHESLLVTHSVNSSPSGVRWYEIRSPGSGPNVYQSGTYSPNSNWRWEGSAAMDKAGDMAIGYSLSSSSMHPAIACAGRLSTDALGTLESENIILTGSGSQQSGNNRWDDYTSLSVDPIDDCTFWYTNEYYSSNSVSSWNTRIVSFKFSSCSAANAK
jgi:hypothetical protein